MVSNGIGYWIPTGRNQEAPTKVKTSQCQCQCQCQLSVYYQWGGRQVGYFQRISFAFALQVTVFAPLDNELVTSWSKDNSKDKQGVTRGLDQFICLCPFYPLYRVYFFCWALILIFGVTSVEPIMFVAAHITTTCSLASLFG